MVEKQLVKPGSSNAKNNKRRVQFSSQTQFKTCLEGSFSPQSKSSLLLSTPAHLRLQRLNLYNKLVDSTAKKPQGKIIPKKQVMFENGYSDKKFKQSYSNQYGPLFQQLFLDDQEFHEDTDGVDVSSSKMTTGRNSANEKTKKAPQAMRLSIVQPVGRTPEKRMAGSN